MKSEGCEQMPVELQRVVIYAAAKGPLFRFGGCTP